MTNHTHADLLFGCRLNAVSIHTVLVDSVQFTEVLLSKYVTLTKLAWVTYGGTCRTKLKHFPPSPLILYGCHHDPLTLPVAKNMSYHFFMLLEFSASQLKTCINCLCTLTVYFNSAYQNTTCLCFILWQRHDLSTLLTITYSSYNTC